MAAGRTFAIVVLVVAGVLVVLFVLGAARAFELRTPDPKKLGTSFGAHRLQLDEVRPESAHACLAVGPAALQVAAVAPCSLDVAASTDPFWRRRAVALEVTGPVHVVVTPVGGSGTSVDGRPDVGQEAEFPIPRGAARIDLQCGASTCTVKWLR